MTEKKLHIKEIYRIEMIKEFVKFRPRRFPLLGSSSDFNRRGCLVGKFPFSFHRPSGNRQKVNSLFLQTDVPLRQRQQQKMVIE